ncbi:MAG TPA: hypothetical protein VHV78_00195 [Gemmatimonadaceae bacterium]|nr:hypothetical protein [Gemmatimonadaceae bacterium]
MLTLYGLAIATAESADTEADIQWDECTATELEDYRGSEVFEIGRDDGPWTRHVFADRTTTFCEFDVSPDGRRVISRALPSVHRADVRELLAEAVMRTIFRRRGIVSFHGAALDRDGTCVLILGAKRAGKSALAGALIRDGWSLLTDDLARVLCSNGQWCVAPGFRQLKLSGETAEHFGYVPRDLALRWSSAAASDTPRSINKHVLKYDPTTDAASPLAGIFVLGPRVAGLAHPCVETLPPIGQLRALIDNLTCDALTPAWPPSRESAAVAGALIRQTSVRSLVMPDHLPAIDETATCIASALLD